MPSISFRFAKGFRVMIWYGGRTVVKSRRTPFGANSFLSSMPPGLARFQ